MDAIVVEGLEKTYGRGVKALDGIRFSVSEGEVFGLLGPNGAGKSTTVRILATLTRADAGSAIVAGHDVMLPVALQVGGAIPSSPMELLTGSGATERVVLGVLGVLSLLSWGIMLAKWVEIRRTRRAADRFLAEFGSVERVDLDA